MRILALPSNPKVAMTAKAYLILLFVAGSWGFEFECDQRQTFYAEHVVLAATPSGMFIKQGESLSQWWGMAFPVGNCMTYGHKQE